MVEWKVEHITSNPYFPQSNGLAEKTVGIAKMMLVKAKDINLALLEYKNTPSVGNKYTPAQLMFNRNLRSILPNTEQYLTTVQVDVKDVHKCKQAGQARQAYYYNRGAKPLKQLEQGAKVQVYKHDKKEWMPAQIVDTHDETPRSYIVQLENGGQCRRNRKDIIDLPANDKDKNDDKNNDEAARNDDKNVNDQNDNLDKGVNGEMVKML